MKFLVKVKDYLLARKGLVAAFLAGVVAGHVGAVSYLAKFL